MTTTDLTTGFLLGIRVGSDRSIHEVRIPTTDGVPELSGITQAIGCDLFDRVAPSENIDLFVDDEEASTGPNTTRCCSKLSARSSTHRSGTGSTERACSSG